MSEQWADLLAVFEEEGSCSVTLRTLSLGSRDSVTGWRAKSFSESTISMIIGMRGTSHNMLPPGVYVRLDAVGSTRDTVAIGDEVKDADSDYYEIKAIRKHKIGATLFFYEVDLTHLPLHS